VSIYKRGNVWWYYIVHQGRHRGSTGTSERAAAQRFHDELKAELWKERRGGYIHSTLDAWAVGKGESDQYHAGKLKRLIEDGPIEGLNPKEIAALLPQNPGTFNRYANVLSAAGIAKLKRKKNPAGRIRWLTAEEWNSLRAELPEHWVPMADFAIATGLRRANVFWLEWGQVDLARRKAWVHADEAKAGDAIGIPLNAAAMAVLEAQRGRSEVWVFPMKDGNPLTKIKTRDWKSAVKRAGIAPCTWHGLRHTWATWHIMGGTPLEVLQRLGGWKDLRMVLRYSHMAESFVDRYAENAKPYGYSHNLGHTG
jgi:integrase